MSIEIMNRAWKHRCATHTQKIVLMALADNANDQGVCWPSLDTLQSKCDLSRQGVLDQIEALTQQGLLSVERTDGRSNRYTIKIPVGTVDPSTPLTPKSTALTTPVYAVDPNHKEPSNNRKAEKPQRMTDEEFIKSLKSNPAYSGIDVDSELGKAKAWCVPRRRQCTQRFFINWLNRAEKPIGDIKPAQPERKFMSRFTKDNPPKPEHFAGYSADDIAYIIGKFNEWLRETK